MMGDKELAEKLLRYKEQIELAKTNLAKAEGKLEELIKGVEKEFNTSNTEEIEKLRKEYFNKKEKAREELEEDMKELEERYAAL